MLAIEHLVEPTRRASERLVLDFDARSKSRLRAKLASGEECGLFLPRGTLLRGGDKLEANDGRIVEVVAAAEPLFEALSGEPLLLTRAAYHLGNRHVAVDMKPGRLRFCADHVLGEMVRGLGLKVTAIEAPFEPEAGAYAHKEIPPGDSGHSHGEATGANATVAKIHQYRQHP